MNRRRTPTASRAMWALCAIVVSLLLIGTPDVRGEDLEATLDFDIEQLPTGQIVSVILAGTEAGDVVGPIGVHGTLPSNAAANSAVIFDSAMRTGGDSDLGSPNETFGGPGTGNAGEMGQPYQNDTAQWKILIVAEDLDDANGDGLVDDPDDGAELGMLLEFDFTTITEPFTPDDVTIFQITTIDAEGSNAGEVRLYDATNTLLSTTPITSTGDNGLLTQDIGDPGVGVSGVARMEVQLNGSSAIDDIAFEMSAREVGDQLWFLNGGDGTISIVSLDGLPIDTISVPGQSGPSGVAVGSDGVTWVAFTDSDAIVRFNTGGNVIDVIPVGDGPIGVAIDTEGCAWVSNQLDNTLWKIASDGTILFGATSVPFAPGSLGGPIAVPAGPAGIGVDLLDNVIVACGVAGIVEKRNANGALVWSKLLPPGSAPKGIAIDRESYAWITDPALGRVERRASDGTLSLEFTGFPAAQPAPLTVRGAEEVWVCGEGDGSLRRLVPGEPAQVFAIGGAPSGISTDGLGQLWITDRVAGTVTRYGSDGAPLQVITIGPGPGYLGDAFGLVPANVLNPLQDFDLDTFPNNLEIDENSNPYDDLSLPSQSPEFVDPVLDLSCVAIVQDVSISWTNPANNDFAEIRIVRGGVLISTLPPTAESFAEPSALDVGIYEYQIIGADIDNNESLSEDCTVVIGSGNLQDTIPIDLPGLAVNLFGLTAVPDPGDGMPAYYLTDPGNDQIYGLDLEFMPIVTIPSPFAGIAPTNGVVFLPTGNGGLGSLLVSAGANGDPLQDATLIEIALDGTQLGDPYVLVRPVPATQGFISIKGGLGGVTQNQDSGVLMAVSPENCELFTFRMDAGAGVLPPTQLVIFPASSAVHPEPGFGLNGVYFPPFSQFGEDGGAVLVSNLTADGFTIARLQIGSGAATVAENVLPFAAATESENVFGDFVVEGDRIAAVGITSSSVYQFGGAFFTRGDANADGLVDVADAVEILMVCFMGVPAGTCVDGLDADDDGTLGVGDTIFLLNYLFSFEPPFSVEPPPPFEQPGPDPTPDGLPCL